MDKSHQKNILFFQNSILPADGGVPRITDVISKELSNRGYNCFYIYFDKDNEEYSLQTKMKIDLKRSYKKNESLVLQFVKQNGINIFVCQNAYALSFIKMYKKIITQDPSKIFISFLHASPDYWMTYKLKNDLSKHKVFFNKMMKILKRIVFPFYNPYIINTSVLFNISTRFILFSNSYKKAFLELYSAHDANKLFFMPNPLTFYDLISHSELKKKEKIVLIVSRLNEHQKKISLALRIWKIISEKNNDDWKLYIIGTGPDEAFYKKYVDENKLSNVIFLGQKLDVLPYYQRSSIFMMTSIWEGFPMTLLEAQQNGVVPIVFDNFSALYDIVSDGENGFIIHDNNMEQFEKKLFELMQSPTLRNEMAVKSIESSKRFHVSNIANEWEKLFDSEIELKRLEFSNNNN
jgi:glycosyltransferase involved in cell wall biosynthesis